MVWLSLPILQVPTTSETFSLKCLLFIFLGLFDKLNVNTNKLASNFGDIPKFDVSSPTNSETLTEKDVFSAQKIALTGIKQCLSFVCCHSGNKMVLLKSCDCIWPENLQFFTQPY